MATSLSGLIPHQFIPVLVLAAFLLVLFVSHLLRFPRFLYFSPAPSTKEYKSFLGISPTSIRLPYSYQSPSYTIPTVRLVHHHSPEPRVYLPQEILIPTPCSPTLVDSDAVDVYSPPSRVYFPPGLADVYESDFYDQLQRYTPQHASHEDIPAPFTPFYDLISTSSDALVSPDPDPFRASSPSFFPEMPDLDDPPSPELSPPPPAYAHPFLVRRALSPWRRRSPPLRSKTTEPVPADSARSIHRHHRPSVPSRLRYFTTRSATASLSSSRNNNNDTPESSLGKRSATTNKSNLSVEPDPRRESHASTAPSRPYSQLVPAPSYAPTQTSSVPADERPADLQDAHERDAFLPALGLGLGLRLGATDDSVSAASDSEALLHTEMPGTADSLRTVLSRWMARRAEGSAEGRRMISAGLDDDEVEVMVVPRPSWEGL